MYKDKDKQREANRARQQRRRDVIKSKGVTNTGCDGQGVTLTGFGTRIRPKRSYIGAVLETPDTISPKRGKDIKCFEDRPDTESNHGQQPPLVGIDNIERTKKILGKPGDEDYNGVCTEEWRAERER